MNYAQMKSEYIQGWHTWNVRSVLSHVHMPDGLAVNLAFKEYMTGAYLKETLIGRFGSDDEKCFPGIHAFDESYTEMTVQWREMEIVVESTVEDGELVLLVTPKTFQIRPAMLVVETGYLWGRPGYTVREGGVVVARSAAGESTIHCSGTPMTDANIPVQSAFLSVALEGPVVISTGRKVSVESAQKLLAGCRAAVLDRAEHYGELSGLYQAMERALAWDTIYDAKIRCTGSGRGCRRGTARGEKWWAVPLCGSRLDDDHPWSSRRRQLRHRNRRRRARRFPPWCKRRCSAGFRTACARYRGHDPSSVRRTYPQAPA